MVYTRSLQKQLEAEERQAIDQALMESKQMTSYGPLRSTPTVIQTGGLLNPPWSESSHDPVQAPSSHPHLTSRKITIKLTQRSTESIRKLRKAKISRGHSVAIPKKRRAQALSDNEFVDDREEKERHFGQGPDHAIIRRSSRRLTQQVKGAFNNSLHMEPTRKAATRKATDSRKRSLVVVFKVAAIKNLTGRGSKRRRVVRLAKQRRVHPGYGFSWFFNPFEAEGHIGPTVEQQWDVYRRIENDLARNYGIKLYLDAADDPFCPIDPFAVGQTPQPLHNNGNVMVTFDNYVKVVASQATSNAIAIRQHGRLRKRFPYVVNGQEFIGEIPNYHDMYTCSLEYLQQTLNVAGMHEVRAKALKRCLQYLSVRNLSMLESGKLTLEDITKTTKGFTPGLFSFAYMDNMSKNEKLLELLEMPLTGLKTAQCLLAFNWRYPVIAVDTHVLTMVVWLGWVPKDCLNKADLVATFLQFAVPDNLKYALHQAFWQHRNVCIKCKANTTPQSKEWDTSICPLEHLLVRSGKKRGEVTLNDKRQRPTSEESKTGVAKAKVKAKSVSIQAIKPEKAIAEGYVLTKRYLDDNFDADQRINNSKPRYSWVLREEAHESCLPQEIVLFEEEKEEIRKWYKNETAKYFRDDSVRPLMVASASV